MHDRALGYPDCRWRAVPGFMPRGCSIARSAARLQETAAIRSRDAPWYPRGEKHCCLLKRPLMQAQYLLDAVAAGPVPRQSRGRRLSTPLEAIEGRVVRVIDLFETLERRAELGGRSA